MVRNVVSTIFAIAVLVLISNNIDSVAASNNSSAVNEDVQSVGPIPPFDWVKLRKYLFYSWASYQQNPQILYNWACCWCNATVPRVTVTHVTEGQGTEGAYGFIGFNDEKEIIVSFRGAYTDLNWINVFEFWQDDYPYAKGAKVEHGFMNYWKSVEVQVIAEVKKLQAKFPDYTVISTGHSLGGSLSLLGAIDMVRAGIKNVQVWNYGQPRVGNVEFAAYATSIVPSIIRITNHHDIAPEIPPALIEGYHHTPTEVWFGTPNDFKTWTVCDHVNGEDPKCINSVLPFLLTPVDHNTYLGYLWAAC